jgi:hypothetical protein
VYNTMSISLIPEKGQTRIYLPVRMLIAKAAELAEQDVSFVHTSHSIYVPKGNIKFLAEEDCSYWEDLNGRSVRMTPGEIARTELTREFGKPKIWVKKSDFDKLDMPPPTYYDGRVREGKLWYVDMKSAYWQIYRHLWLDVLWPRGTGQLPLKNVADRLAGNKLARNAVVGISRSRLIFMDTPTGTKRLYFHNHFLNPSLWRTIQSVLHEVATEAIERGAFYVATDGYLFDNLDGFDSFLDYLDKNLFAYQTEAGKGYVRGWASYKVGRKQTKVKAREAKPLDKVKKDERGTVEWLRRLKVTT